MSRSRAARAAVAGLTARGASPERIEAARTELAAAKIDDFIERTLAAAPSISPERRLRSAAILFTQPGQDGEAA